MDKQKEQEIEYEIFVNLFAELILKYGNETLEEIHKENS